MDNKDLANLIFPDVKDYTYYEEKYSVILKNIWKYMNKNLKVDIIKM